MTASLLDKRLFLSRRTRYDRVFGLERLLRLAVLPSFKVVPSGQRFAVLYRDIIPSWGNVRTMWNDDITFASAEEAEKFAAACALEAITAKRDGEAACRKAARERLVPLFWGKVSEEPSTSANENSVDHALDYRGRFSARRLLTVFTPRFRIVEVGCTLGFRYEVQTRGIIPVWRAVRYDNGVRVSERTKAEAEGFVALCVENFVENRLYTPEERREWATRERFPHGRPRGYAVKIPLPHEGPMEA